jgi:hypothetical protein
MSKHTVTFIGDPNPKAKGDRRDSVSIYGLAFEIDEPKVLDAAEPGIARAVAKLRGNSHFRVEDGHPAVGDWPADAERVSPPPPPNAVEPPTPLEEAIAQAPHPAETPEAVAKRAQRAAKKAAKQG